MCSSSNPNIFFSLFETIVSTSFPVALEEDDPHPSEFGRVKINPDHLPRDETKGNICCLPVVLSLQEVELLLDAINRLADCQLERGRLWTLNRNKFKNHPPNFIKKFHGGKSMINQSVDWSNSEVMQNKKLIFPLNNVLSEMYINVSFTWCLAAATAAAAAAFIFPVLMLLFWWCVRTYRTTGAALGLTVVVTLAQTQLLNCGWKWAAAAAATSTLLENSLGMLCTAVIGDAAANGR